MAQERNDAERNDAGRADIGQADTGQADIGTGRPRRALLQDPADTVALQRAAIERRNAGDWLPAVRLFLRAFRLHGDRGALDEQIGGTLIHALNGALVLAQNGAIDQAAASLEPLAAVLPPQDDFARVLGTLRLIQGRDAEARELHDAARDQSGSLGVALAGVTRHAADRDVVGTVVIPVHRMEDTIVRALDSVAAAARFYRKASGKPDAQIHICVVDDCSPDDTGVRALRWAREHPEQSMALIANNRNQGAGRSRNAGAAAALGRYLWFLDADDWYFEPHLFLTAEVLDRTPDAGFVRTRMLFDSIDADITPVWRNASENSYPCNLCVRRECHELTGGFPEEPPFHPAVADDVAYGRALHSLFGGLKLAEKTVHYTLRTDNAFARQRAEMTGDGRPEDRGPPDARFMAIEILTQRRLYALDAKRALLLRTGGWAGPPLLAPSGTPAAQPPAKAAADAAPPAPAPAPAPDEAGRWLAAGRELLQANQPERALSTLFRAVALDPGRLDGWFQLGLAAHRLQRKAPALRGFRAVAVLQPDAAGARFNLASMLLGDGAYAEAAAGLYAAAALRPEHANTLVLLGRAVRPLGRAAEARRLFDRAMRIEPAHTGLHADCAAAALEQGDRQGAVRHARHALLANPALYEGHAALAAALDALGRPDEALSGWERAILCNPGFGEAFTRRAVTLLTRHLGPPPPPRAAGAPGSRLTSSALGRNGRFGNQLLQYGVLRLYAARRGLTLEAPDWLGRHLYGFDDPLPGPPLPRVPEATAEAAVIASLRGEGDRLPADRDVAGYFCGETSPLAPFRDEFRALFVPGRRLRPHADALGARLRDAGRTVVALHIRRGDFGWGPFWTAPEAWYLRWLEQVWPTLDHPVLYVATDSPARLEAFAAYRPIAAGDVAGPIPGAEFFTDFHALCQADLVAISNSSFSFVATMLNRTARGFLRPDRTRDALVPYDPWASPVLI